MPTLDPSKLNAAERTLLETLTANRNASESLEGVRGKVLLAILRAVGIAITDSWLRCAARMENDASPTHDDVDYDGVDYEALILDRQGEQFGTTDSY